MDSAEFEELLYTIFSEEPFNNQIINIKEEKYDYIISDYVSQYFGMLIGETMTCISFHKKMSQTIK